MTAKLKSIAAEPRKRMHDRIGETGEWLQQVVRGYYNHHAVPGNLARMSMFRPATRETARKDLCGGVDNQHPYRDPRLPRNVRIRMANPCRGSKPQ